MINMDNDRIRKYDELEADEKEVLDVFRQMKLIADYNKFKLYKYKVENLIEDYEELKKLREEIQSKYFSIYDELIEEGLIEGELDASIWGITREQENETWDSELKLMSEIKTNFDMAINMIESGEAEQSIIDEGTITATTVITPTGETPGYEYAGNKIKTDDVVTLSVNSDIGKPTVKKYTAAEGEIILGIAVNDPVTMTGGKRKTAILVLGHLFRLKLASGLSNIAVNDRIALTSTGAIKSDEGEYIAMHPVTSSDDYKYIEVFRPYDIGTTGST